MALKPLRDAVFLDIIEHEPDQALANELDEATSQFLKAASKRILAEAAIETRRLQASITAPKQVTQQGLVIACGPECKELAVNDLVVFPMYSGSMVTVIDEGTEEYKRVFVISEKACLARYRDD